MYQVGQFLELPVIDHLIITETEFYSFVDSGLPRKARAGARSMCMQYKKEEERLREEGVQIGKKMGHLEKAIQMAKIMKKKGV